MRLMPLMICLSFFLSADAPAFSGEKVNTKSQSRIYFGTYTRGESEGIYTALFDQKTGKIGEVSLAANTINPSFLALHPSGKFLYAVNETSKFQDQPGGGITAFAINADGTLKELNTRSSKGGAPCHLVVDKAGKTVLAANYSGGNVISYQLKDNGELGEEASFHQHEGTGGDPSRQKGPHAHSINLDAAENFAFAVDLGLDKILVYKFDSKTGKLIPNDPPFAKTVSAGGPRHFSFHPSGKYAWVLNEMKMSITGFKYDAAKGTLEMIETLSTLPEGTTGKGLSTAEVLVHPSGKFVYSSNRGHDSIALFTVDEATGKLTFVETKSSGGKTPRNFNIDPSGRFLLTAGQNSGDIHVFKINPKTGKLKATGTTAAVAFPVCIKFLGVSK